MKKYLFKKKTTKEMVAFFLKYYYKLNIIKNESEANWFDTIFHCENASFTIFLKKIYIFILIKNASNFSVLTILMNFCFHKIYCENKIIKMVLKIIKLLNITLYSVIFLE